MAGGMAGAMGGIQQTTPSPDAVNARAVAINQTLCSMMHPIECVVSKPEQCSFMLQEHTEGSLNLIKDLADSEGREDHKEYCTAQGFSLSPREDASGQQQDASGPNQQDLSGAPLLVVSGSVAALIAITV